ncbi:hypothetical protein IGI37_002114 [Enterococcus sp. AZ194]|uniref:ImmA/IrrE family metallo-endopeptidase n=1 Tax=Enterococcus sp. AZ194 TaxID=2774629 RepID=UPI003F2065B5
MANYEYQKVNVEDYLNYSDKAQSLLFQIAAYQKVSLAELRYFHIIEYFEDNFNIHFTFFSEDISLAFDNLVDSDDRAWQSAIEPDSSWIKNPNIVKSADFTFLDQEICSRISGITIPMGKRTLIMINQDCVTQRIIFTILHELCHFYFHVMDKSKKQYFVSLSNEQIDGKYSPELIPFENEANIIGSILFCTNERLEYMLKSEYTFKDMCRSSNMSAPAMHNRLLNFFNYTLGIASDISLSYVWKFRRGNKRVFLIINRYIYSWRKKINEENKLLTLAQTEYMDKLAGSSFWNEILQDMEVTSDDFKPIEEVNPFGFLDDDIFK